MSGTSLPTDYSGFMNSPVSQERNCSFKGCLAQEVKQKSESTDYHNSANLPEGSAPQMGDDFCLVGFGHFEAQTTFPGLSTVFSSYNTCN